MVRELTGHRETWTLRQRWSDKAHKGRAEPDGRGLGEGVACLLGKEFDSKFPRQGDGGVRPEETSGQRNEGTRGWQM